MLSQLPELEGSMWDRQISAGLNLGYNESFLRTIFTPIETITGEIPMTIDQDGSRSLHCFHFARMVANPFGGDPKSQGGLKVTEGILPDVALSIGGDRYYSLKELAFSMAFKHFITNTGFAGAKAAIEVPKMFTSNNTFMEVLLYKLGRNFVGQVLNPLKGGMGPDTNTGNGKMNWVVKGLMNADNDGKLPGWNAKDARSVITGKSPELGGLSLREKSTGYGVALATVSLIDKIKRKFNNFMARIGVQGTGAVGLATIEKLIELNYKVTSFSTLGDDNIPYTVICLDGFSSEHLSAINNGRLNLQLARKFKEIEILEGGDHLFGSHINLIIPCACENIVAKRHLLKITDLQGIVEGANAPLTIEAANYVIQYNIPREIAETANSLGVYMSVLERKAANEGYIPTADQQFVHLLQGRTNIDEMILQAESNFPNITISSAMMYHFVDTAAKSRLGRMETSRHVIYF